jgi:hypothetical protein
MSLEPPHVLTDPVGAVVTLICDAEPAVDRTVVHGVVEAVAGGRAKRRRLAHALQSRPGVLTDGRSPAPRVVGDLLIALRVAGVAGVSPPVCAQCGKHLYTLQRRGEDWFCGVCGPILLPCTGCGKTTRVATRDQQGQPRCKGCPPGDGRNPMTMIVEAVAGVDSTITTDTVIAAVKAAVSQEGQRHQMVWALHERPELFTGSGAEAGVPSVLRLIDALCRAGALNIVRPPCPHCGRVIALVKPRNGVRLCRNCVAKSRAEPCSRCGAVREAATRDEHGRPLCPNCLITDPANQETCISCERRRPVSNRTPDGPLCENCRPWPILSCDICGRTAACAISQATGKPWCRACKQRWVRCAGCGEVRPIRGGTVEAPLCSTCTRPDPGFWPDCTGCGQPGRLGGGRCARCTVDQRLRDLFNDNDGQIRPQLQALYQALTTAECPSTVAAWLDRSAAAATLAGLDAGKLLTHTVLDELDGGKPIEHLRSVLVAIGTLPHRDEQMARLERWITRTITARTTLEQREVLHRYAVWHILHRLRRRLGAKDTTHTQIVGAQRHVAAAIILLVWLTTKQLTLGTCQQRDLDTWIASEEATHRREAGHFIRWANTQKLTTLRFPTTRWDGPSGIIDTETRWEQARRLLHDDSLPPDDRVAGLLVLLYAQWPATISRLTLDPTSRPPTTRYGSRSGRSRSYCPNRWPGSPVTSSHPAAATPSSATREPPLGCSPAGNPADRSAPTRWPNDSATSASDPVKPARPPCSNSPSTCPQRSSPACSASTSPSPSPGNAPAAATGPATPPTSAGDRHPTPPHHTIRKRAELNPRQRLDGLLASISALVRLKLEDGPMKIVIEDVTTDFARELVELALTRGLNIITTSPEWTPARAESLLRDLPDTAVEIIRLTVHGHGWGDAEAVRGDDGASLRGRTGSITQAIKRGIKTGRLPEGLPSPVIAQYDPNNPSYQRTTGFTMPEELLPAFRAAFDRL